MEEQDESCSFISSYQSPFKMNSPCSISTPPRFLMILLVFFLCHLSFGQYFKSGYVITLNGDTLHGTLFDAGEMINAKKCIFKQTNTNKTITYHPSDIKAYNIDNSKHFVSTQTPDLKDEQALFMEVLVEADVNLYYRRNGKKTRFYIQKENGKLVGLENDFGIVRFDKDFTKVTTSNSYYVDFEIYKDSLYVFFDKTESIRMKLGDLEYGKAPLMQLTQAMVSENCDAISCIRYVKDLKRVRDRAGIQLGALYSNYAFHVEPEEDNNGGIVDPPYDVSTPVSSLFVGLSYEITIKMISDRLAFQPEFIYQRTFFQQDILTSINTYHTVGVDMQNLKLPLLIKYKFPTQKIRPVLAGGWEINYIMDMNNKLHEEISIKNRFEQGRWVAQIGCEVDLNRKIGLFANVKLSSKPKAPKEGERSSTVATYHAAARTDYASFHVGIMF